MSALSHILRLRALVKGDKNAQPHRELRRRTSKKCRKC